MFFKQIFDEQLAQYAYLIGCQQTGEAIIIDPERDIDRYIDIAEHENLNIVAAADTHIHADYLTGLREFAERGIKVYVSDEGGDDWRYEWLLNNKKNYTFELLKDGERFSIGNINFDVLHTPGHTPEHISFMLTDGAASEDPMGIFSGDFVFVGDLGRPDLLESAAGIKDSMEPAAQRLYQSVQKFKEMPEYLQVWPAHGAGSACGKALGAVPDSTVGYELRNNASIAAAQHRGHFVDYILEGQPEPPMYFARMKRDNREGPAVLGSLPEPPHLSFETFLDESKKNGAIVVDTRSVGAYMHGHLPNSILAPFNKSFPTVAGSYISEDESIYLICDSRDVSKIVTALIRIGLDNIAGYITPEFIELQHEEGRVFNKINIVDFGKADTLLDQGYSVLDVRGKMEYEAGHIEGAENIAHTRLAGALDQLDRSTPYLVHCRMGGRAAVASAFLKRSGYNVTFIDGYINDYLNQI